MYMKGHRLGIRSECTYSKLIQTPGIDPKLGGRMSYSRMLFSPSLVNLHHVYIYKTAERGRPEHEYHTFKVVYTALQLHVT